MKLEKLFRCALYTRKITEEGLEQAFNSLDAQREACEAYVKSQAGDGWIALPALYDDGGYSGGNMERPALKALLADIDRGLIDIVVVYKVDRLTRALADFAKIVERFDKRNVSFVSVTQAFNTTTSMGRLTLNVLLSFAQFEREVTSERIRDKLAASRRKGMWMGGRPPFGYVVREKKIYPDPEDAPRVRAIFQRYLDLGSVRTLRDELKSEGVISRPWVSRHGHSRGGMPFDRGALYHLLQNRLYVGEIQHKEERHKGQHEAIVPLKLFDEAQARFAENRKRQLGRPRSAIRHPLAGLLWDDGGNRMSPTTGHGRAGQRFRYYVSVALIKGHEERLGELARIPADDLEAVVLHRVSRLLGTITGHAVSAKTKQGADEAAELPRTLLQALVERIDLATDSITIRLREDQLNIQLAEAAAALGRRARPMTVADWQARLPASDRLVVDDGILCLTIPGGPVRRGGQTVIETPDGSDLIGARKPDPALLKAIARAHIWLDRLLRGDARTLRELAEVEGVQERYIRRVIPLAFLSPRDLEAVFDGAQRRGLTVDAVAADGLPLAWQS